MITEGSGEILVDGKTAPRATARNREHGQVAAAVLLLQVESVVNLQPQLLDRTARKPGFHIGLGFHCCVLFCVLDSGRFTS